MNQYKGVTEKSKALWNQLADEWDAKMGEHDNRYHREIIRPAEPVLRYRKAWETEVNYK